MFTREQIEEIRLKLILVSRKDTLFPLADPVFKGNEEIAFILDSCNVRMNLNEFINTLLVYKVSDLINVSTDGKFISLGDAVLRIPPKTIKLGLVITFLDESISDWSFYLFIGEDIAYINDTTLWKNIFSGSKFKGYFLVEQTLKKSYPYPVEGDFAFVGQCMTDALLYVCSQRGLWTNTHIPALEFANKYEAILSRDVEDFSYILNERNSDTSIKDGLNRVIHDTYVTKSEVGVEIDDAVSKSISNIDVSNGSITMEKLSDAVKLYIGSLGSIVNAPDDEDLTVTSTNLLKFKDKEYNPNCASGLGRVYLRQNPKAGKNVLEQRMINKPNTIYIILYDYDLEAQTITIPDGCVLQFEGGSFKNGTIIGSNTKINNEFPILHNVLLKGTFNGDFNDMYVQNTSTIFLKNLFSCGFNNIILIKDYNVNNETIEISGNITLDGTISVNTYYALDLHYIFLISNKSNLSIRGKGSIIGDKLLGGTKTLEWKHAISIVHSSNINIEGLTFKNFWGDAIAINQDKTDNTNFSKDIIIRNCIIENVARNGISIIHGYNITIKDCIFKDIVNGSVGSCIDIEPNAGTTVDDIILHDISISNINIINCYLGIMIYGSHKSVENVNIENITYNTTALGLSVSYGKNINIKNIRSIKSTLLRTSDIYIDFSHNIDINNIYTTEVTSNNFFDIKSSSNIAITNSKVICSNFILSSTPTNLKLKFSDISCISLLKSSAAYLYATINNLYIENCIVSSSDITSIEPCIQLSKSKNIFVLNNSFYSFKQVLKLVLVDGSHFNKNYISTDSTNTVLYANSTSKNTNICSNIINNVLTPDYIFDVEGGLNAIISDNIIINGYRYGIHRIISTNVYNAKINLSYSSYGPTSKRPILKLYDIGFTYYDIDVKKQLIWTGVAWVDTIIMLKGPSASIPLNLTDANVGFLYYNTTDGVLYIWNGVNWVNEDGTLITKVVII